MEGHEKGPQWKTFENALKAFGILGGVGGAIVWSTTEFTQLKSGLAQLRDLQTQSQAQLRDLQAQSQAQLRDLQAQSQAHQAQMLGKLEALPNIYGKVEQLQNDMGAVLNNALPPRRR